MTADDIYKNYPHCPIAVAYCELILDTPDEDTPETSFALMRRADPPLSLEEAFDLIKETVGEETACHTRKARSEMDHPQFLVYLGAKLGMM